MQNEKKDKSLKKKAVTIQGKSYVLVADRIIFFNEQYLNGTIQTQIMTDLNFEQGNSIVMKAIITPDMDKPTRYFTGYSQEVIGQGYINKTSALENAETSAVGRALAMMGIGVIDSIASVDEIKKAENRKSENIINNTKQHFTNSSYEKKYDDKPWLSEGQLSQMLKFIEDGHIELVKKRMTEYKIRKTYQEKLNDAFNNVSSETKEKPLIQQIKDKILNGEPFINDVDVNNFDSLSVYIKKKTGLSLDEANYQEILNKL